MKLYTPPLADIKFLLSTFGYDERIHAIEAFEDFDLETSMGLLEAYSDFCVEVLQPLNGPGDSHGVKFIAETGAVVLPPGFKEAWDGFTENGFTSVSFDPEYGGLGAPHVLGTLASEMLIATNKSFSMCPGLTNGLVEALSAYGTKEQKDTFLEKLITGEWTGTMCLTEPQCGTDLGLITTRAEPEGEHFKLTGTKTWITFGEHDLSDNIIHLVLARLPDAPAGIRGISAFIVPKVLEGGGLNGVTCGGTDHKMGIHASPTCVINMEDSVGYMLGQPHRGMKSMFVMMNSARLHVGIEGVALAEASYQAALEYAKDRRQSRSLDPSKRQMDEEADNILVHPDVRRMLLNCKSTNEALRGLVAWIGINYDLSNHATDEDERQKASDLVALFTPIIKSYGTERGFLNASEAMQVMGGAGYTQDWPVEQYMRDLRIALIYEGTNHIQALDLVGRKLPMGNGRLFTTFMGEVSELIRGCKGNEALAPFVDGLKTESKRLTNTTLAMSGVLMKDPETVGAIASNYLNQFALTTLAYVWIRQLQAAQQLPEDDALRRSKFQTARFFFELVLPEAAMYATKVAAGKSCMVDIDIDLL